MTSKEAIDIIKSECYVLNPINFDRTIMINTALDMAVKALEQEPCEDAISRQAVIDAMCEASIPTVYKGKPSFIIDYVGVIETVPSVKPQPKVVRWLDEFGGCECSECGCLEAGHSDYCPNCGAKMEDMTNGDKL